MEYHNLNIIGKNKKYPLKSTNGDSAKSWSINSAICIKDVVNSRSGLSTSRRTLFAIILGFVKSEPSVAFVLEEKIPVEQKN